MKTTWKTALLAGIMCQTAIHAQIAPPLTVSSTGTNPVDFEFRADGTLIAKGNYGIGSLLSTDQGAGTRMLWYPAKGAFRVGAVSDDGANKWDIANIGSYSVALGKNTQSSGYASTAMGADDYAFGNCSTSMGSHTWAIGPYSTAMGGSTVANGMCATSMGVITNANGDCSTSMGEMTTATAIDSLVIGRMNVGGGNPTQWVETDPLFEIGNGDWMTWQTSNAFTVFKNGNAILQGTLQAAPGGDIPMFDGN